MPTQTTLNKVLNNCGLVVIVVVVAIFTIDITVVIFITINIIQIFDKLTAHSL